VGAVKERPAFIFATVMTLTAGFVDAIGYTHIGKLYLSFMSGNTTRFGIAVAEWDQTTILLAGAVIALFVLGAGLGALLTDAPSLRPMARVLGVEVALFALALALVLVFDSGIALLPVAVAMGMQNSVHQVVLKADIGKSFVTGALFSLGQALARALRDRDRSAEWLVYAASWGSFVTGVALGSLVLMHASLALALGIAMAVLAALALLALRENE
jgi:uncharacterized membrane protein YoaK (UPF0700 family)